MGGVPNCLSTVEDGPVATELKFKSRENNSERGILNPAPLEKERSLPFSAEVDRSCPAPAGVEAKTAATMSPTIKKEPEVMTDDFFTEPILRY